MNLRCVWICQWSVVLGIVVHGNHDCRMRCVLGGGVFGGFWHSLDRARQRTHSVNWILGRSKGWEHCMPESNIAPWGHSPPIWWGTPTSHLCVMNAFDNVSRLYFNVKRCRWCGEHLWLVVLEWQVWDVIRERTVQINNGMAVQLVGDCWCGGEFYMDWCTLCWPSYTLACF